MGLWLVSTSAIVSGFVGKLDLCGPGGAEFGIHSSPTWLGVFVALGSSVFAEFMKTTFGTSWCKAMCLQVL